MGRQPPVRGKFWILAKAVYGPCKRARAFARPCAKPGGAPAAHHDSVLHIVQVFGERVRSEAVITAFSRTRSRDALAAHSNGGSSQ